MTHLRGSAPCPAWSPGHCHLLVLLVFSFQLLPAWGDRGFQRESGGFPLCGVWSGAGGHLQGKITLGSRVRLGGLVDLHSRTQRRRA